MEKIIDRFDKYMKYKGLNDNKVTIQIDLSVGLLGKSRNEGRDLSKNMIDKILNFYKDLNKVWLLTGEGEMINPNFVPRSLLEKALPSEILDGIKPKDPEYKRSGIIKYYDIDASAGNIEMFDPANGGVHKELMVPGFADCDFALNIWGDSMYPVLCNGSIILCKEWRQDFIEYGAIYLVITKENHRMIKYLHPGISDEYLLCLSENKLFNPFEIKKADILKLYLVKGHIERNAI